AVRHLSAGGPGTHHRLGGLLRQGLGSSRCRDPAGPGRGQRPTSPRRRFRRVMTLSSMRRVFCDASVLVRYFAGDDAPRGFAAAGLVDSDAQLFVSTGVLIELVHALRTQEAIPNPPLADA